MFEKSFLPPVRETKAKHRKKELIIEYLQASVDALFIDEAQDLDADALALFGKLSESIYAYIVGDPLLSDYVK